MPAVGIGRQPSEAIMMQVALPKQRSLLASSARCGSHGGPGTADACDNVRSLG